MALRQKEQVPPGSESGAALLIIVAILAIIAALSIGTRYFGGSTRQLSQKVETQQDDIRFEDGLLVFLVRNNRLPCPADITEAVAANQGREERDGAGNCTAAFGTQVLPWKDIGLSENQVRDAWGNYYSYHPLARLVLDGAYDSTSANFTFDADGKLVGDGLKIKAKNVDAGYITQSALMVVISHGPNGDSAYRSATVQKAVSTDADEMANTDGDVGDIYVKSGTPGGKFDDILIYWLDRP